MNETLMAATESGDGCEVCIELEALIQTRRSLGAAATPPDHRPRIEDEVARRGIRLHGTGPEREGPCQVCGGTDRFSINTKKQVWNCRGCQQGGDVYELAMHLDGIGFGEAAELLDGRPNGHAKERTIVYDYQDEHGAIVYQVERIDYYDGRKKKIRQRRPDPDHPGEWLWKVAGHVKPVLYRLPELIEDLAHDRAIVIVEGERKVDLLRS
jgi:CHC2 zinc finger